MIELPQISQMNTTQDVNKQLAYIRSYLNQLKDEIESELNNVTYDMLSRELKKRIDMITDDIIVGGEDKKNSNLVLDSLICQYASVGRLIATLGEIQTLTSMLATINTIAAEVITTTTLTATTINAQSVETTGNVKAKTLVTAPTIEGTTEVKGKKGTFDELNVPGGDFQNEDGTGLIKVNNIQGTNGGLGGSIKIGEVGTLTLKFGNDQRNVFVQEITTETGTYNVLAI